MSQASAAVGRTPRPSPVNSLITSVDRKLALLVVILIPVLALLLGRQQYYANVLINACLVAGLAGSWNIVGGMTGRVSLGHAAFYGIGAYGTALLFLRQGVPPIVGVWIAAGIAALVSGAVGYLTLRFKGPFYTLATIALGEILRIIAINVPAYTGGALGLLIPFRAAWQNLIFPTKIGYLIVAYLYMVLVLAVLHGLNRSRMGYYLAAVRDDEEAAEAIGVPVARWKIRATFISGLLTGLGGGLAATHVLFLEPITEFALERSINFALMAMIGGLKSTTGPIVGGLLLSPVQELIRGWLGGWGQGLHQIVFGLALLLMVRFAPGGLVDYLSRFQRRSKTSGAAGLTVSDRVPAVGSKGD